MPHALLPFLYGRGPSAGYFHWEAETSVERFHIEIRTGPLFAAWHGPVCHGFDAVITKEKHKPLVRLNSVTMELGEKFPKFVKRGSMKRGDFDENFPNSYQKVKLDAQGVKFYSRERGALATTTASGSKEKWHDRNAKTENFNTMGDLYLPRFAGPGRVSRISV